MITLAAAKKELREISRLFYSRGWSLATSGNYSVRLDVRRMLITTTGMDKGKLRESDTVVVDLTKNDVPVAASAEAMLHRELYRLRSDVCAILHTHSAFSTVLSIPPVKEIVFSGYEMLKALRGVKDPQEKVAISVFINEQDMPSLAKAVGKECKERNPLYGFALASHGLYSLGSDIQEAKRHAETLEFLLECEYRRRIIKLTTEER